MVSMSTRFHHTWYEQTLLEPASRDRSQAVLMIFLKPLVSLLTTALGLEERESKWKVLSKVSSSSSTSLHPKGEKIYFYSHFLQF